MQQDLFYKQQEFAQAYQLGSLEAEYAIDPRKILANFVFILVFALLAPPILLGITHTATNPVNFIIPSLIFFTFLGGAILLGFYFYYRYLHIYVYTYGLVYLNGNKSRVAYWRQMKRAYTNRGYLNISVQNETGISIPSYVSRFSELRARVKQAIASYRNLG